MINKNNITGTDGYGITNSRVGVDEENSYDGNNKRITLI